MKRICFAAVILALALPAGAEDHGMSHDHHMMMQGDQTMDHDDAMPQGDVPPLHLMMPREGAVVDPQLAVVFHTPGEMQSLTMGTSAVGTHLHIDTANVSLMPTRDQLVSLGNGTYLFLFDLPEKPGPVDLKVYWSDAMHRTIEDSIQHVRVTVRDPKTQ